MLVNGVLPVTSAKTGTASVRSQLDGFRRLVATADRHALGSGLVPFEMEKSIRRFVAELELVLNSVIGDEANIPPARAKAVGERVQAELLPYLLMSRNAERWYAKPRGHAGDYLTIAQMYEDREEGFGRIGRLIDRSFLQMRAVRAVRNRRDLLSRRLEGLAATAEAAPARVTSLACGPAQEVADVMRRLATPDRLDVTLVDNDPAALRYAATGVRNVQPGATMRTIKANLIKVSLDPGAQVLPGDQDLVYSIGLIDYFDDNLVVALMNAAHRSLAPGGRLILGNFHPSNPSKAVMDHVLDWRLNHRTLEELDLLLQASDFRRPSVDSWFEEEGINLFVECVKHG